MSKLLIYRAKPNPAGKDTFHNMPLPRQLQGEWVDLTNTTTGDLTLRGASLDHTAFGANCADRRNAAYWQDTEGLVLGAGQVLRIHTGKAADAGQMAEEDRVGAHIHRWAGHGLFKLNNGACGDTLTVWYFNGSKHELIDQTSYDPYPPEGMVLVRQNGKLVAAVRSYVGRV